MKVSNLAPSRRRQLNIVRYASTVVLIVAVGMVHATLRPPGAVRAPFLFFYPAIALAAFLGGAGPGLIALLASAAWAAIVFVFQSQASWIYLITLGPILIAAFSRLRYIREKSRIMTRESVRFRFISDNATDWIFLTDENWIVQYANRTAADQLGYPASDLSGRAFEDLLPDSQKEEFRTLARNFAPDSRQVAEIAFARRDGAPVALEIGCAAVKTGKEVVMHIAGRNVSDRRQLDQKLRDARHWESLGVLAGGLAHDFNNLLMTILGNTALAREAAHNPAAVVELLEGVEHAGDRCAELVRLMLATAAYRPRHSEPLHVDRILNTLLAARPLPPGVRVVTEVNCDGFRGDRNSIETLLWSLISNAAESYGEAGGLVTVTMKSGAMPALDHANFEEGERSPAKSLGIVVEDRGCGIAPAVLERAFDPFYTTKFTGRGLGLPAVRGIVRAYSGKLWLKTAPAVGTRVEAWLPEA